MKRLFIPEVTKLSHGKLKHMIDEKKKQVGFAYQFQHLVAIPDEEGSPSSKPLAELEPMTDPSSQLVLGKRAVGLVLEATIVDSACQLSKTCRSNMHFLRMVDTV
jgi:hypothetical protein